MIYYYFLTKNSSGVYRLYYSLIDEDKIGWYNLDAFFCDFVKNEQKMLFIELDKVISEITMSPYQAEALAESASANPSEAILRAHNIKNNNVHQNSSRVATPLNWKYFLKNPTIRPPNEILFWVAPRFICFSGIFFSCT